MIKEICSDIPKVLGLIAIIVFGSQFEYIYSLTQSKKVFVAQLSKLIVGSALVYICYDIIMKVPAEFVEIVIFGVSINSIWIVDYFREKFKAKAKERIDKKLSKHNEENKIKDEKTTNNP